MVALLTEGIVSHVSWALRRPMFGRDAFTPWERGVISSTKMGLRSDIAAFSLNVDLRTPKRCTKGKALEA